MTSLIPGNNTLPVSIYPGSGTSEVTISQDNTNLVLSGSSNVQTIRIDQSADTQIAIDYTSSKIGNTVSITNGYDVLFHAPHENSVQDDHGKIAISDSTTLTGPAGWDGLLKLPATTLVTIPQETTTTTTNGVTTTTTTIYSEVSAFEIGVDGSTIQLSSPARIEFTGDGGNGFVVFFVGPNGITTFINTQCSSDSASGLTANECFIDNGSDVIVWTNHFTKFGTSRQSTSSSSTAGPTAESTGGGGKIGVHIPGASIKGISGTPGFELQLSTKLEIAMISYDKCEQNIVKIFVASNSDSVPTVQLVGASSTMIQAKLVSGSISSVTEPNVFAYEAPISSDTEFFMVTAQTTNRGISNTVATLVDVTQCKQALMFQQDIPNLPSPDESSSVEIFDLKINLGDGAKRASQMSNTYASNHALPVSAIVSSPSDLKLAEIRFVTLNGQQYSLLKENMTIASIGLPNLYSVSGTIPYDAMSPPAIIYWVRVMNQDAVIHDSEKYTIGVKPIEPISASMKIDSKQYAMSGTTIYPSVSFYNTSPEPIYGYTMVSINDTPVFASEPQLYLPGATEMPLSWHIPHANEFTRYDIASKTYAYDKIFENTTTLDVFPSARVIPLGTINVSMLKDPDGNKMAKPFMLYSSLENIEGDYRVIMPDGTCLIGTLDVCLVNESTSETNGTSITVNDKTYKIRYSGNQSSFERFSIMSDDLVEGNWIVQIHSEKDSKILDSGGKIKVSYRLLE
ncbi:MAG: hypothetical protein HZB73_07525 [Nitrosarchaeum sp.]|nr:hypothetical protein [Nitrosarchaeum sp.]